MVGADGAPLMYAKRLKRRAVQHAAAPSACDEGLTQVSDLRTPSSNAAAAAPESSIAEAAQGSREQSRHLNINKTDACHEYRHAAGRKQGDAAVSSARFSDDFRSLGIKEWLHRICKTLGMTKPTEVQAACIPAILDGRSVIGSAHTGSGKTAAFALPILQLLAADRYGVFALVLTPTRELAFQLTEQFEALGAGMDLRTCVVVGGLDSQAQACKLAARPHVVIATPGRLRALLMQQPELAQGFLRARFLVLDEADRLLEPTFQAELFTITEAMPEKRQTLLFSATLTPSLVALHSSRLADAFVYQAYEGMKAAVGLRQEYVFMPGKVKDVYLFYVLAHLANLGVRSVIVFTSTCKGAHLLGYELEELGLQAVHLHSHLNQRRRLAALQRFKSGKPHLEPFVL